ncbi:ureidoglycolate lyase [Mesorhizobium atlanticum]|uniref:Ureidoglycolate hydrolase n=1 Tax=Mesorhizobium atlanticum TaxID=2233532 RepID=A0A330GIZ5_9HYPH|nr:ureidoglycolate lyase [Mesorhizobium atlanticum]RAZ72343.1 hypothetical protein DPM35_28760 [Mesorhizobium atlanticum]
MTGLDHIVARHATAEAFARFGTVYDLDGGRDEKVVWTDGNSWRDGFTHKPLISGSGHLGMTSGAAAPWRCAEMERHLGTEEAIFCAGAPVVLAVAPASAAPAPRRDEIEAFIVSPGQAVVMDRGVWHDACRGLTQPTAYFWMAICGLGASPWVPVEGGPLLVLADAGQGAIA